MHRVAVVPDHQQPSQGTRAAAVVPPIGPYDRGPVVVHRADPHAAAVAGRLIALLASSWPSTPAEHVGSSAVPGLAGKNIIDLLVAAAPADIGAITAALLELGFQPQCPAAFPPSRPMLWGSFHYGPARYRVHVHVVLAASPEVAAIRGSIVAEVRRGLRTALPRASPPTTPAARLTAKPSSRDSDRASTGPSTSTPSAVPITPATR
jgi:GrpB-like predicted nucleotidyltransferase (UPF0157 family)